LLAADYTIRISVEKRSSDYVYEVVDNVLVVLEVLCNIDSIAVVFVFFDFLDSWTKFILLGTKKGFRFSGLMGAVDHDGPRRKLTSLVFLFALLLFLDFVQFAN